MELLLGVLRGMKSACSKSTIYDKGLVMSRETVMGTAERFRGSHARCQGEPVWALHQRDRDDLRLTAEELERCLKVELPVFLGVFIGRRGNEFL